jgi:acyl carrier protein
MEREFVVTVASRGAALDQQVVELVAKQLYLPVEDVRPEQTFAELGLDSILAVELTADIKTAYGVQLQAADIYEHTTPRAFARLIEQQLDAKG